MATTKPTGYPASSHPILSQTQNNTTLWIGHLQSDPHNHFGGQTFTCTADGLVNNIQVYSSAVHQPGNMILTLHEFEPLDKIWGQVIGDATVFLQKGDDARWIRFYLRPVSLYKGNAYGFRLQASNALIAIGEAASNARQPFSFGHEWNADTRNERGYYFSYFSLAFKVEIAG